MSSRTLIFKPVLLALGFGLSLVAVQTVHAGRGGSHAQIKRAIATDNPSTIIRKLEQAEYLWSGAAIDTVMGLLDHPEYSVREAAAWWFARRVAQRDEIAARAVSSLQGDNSVVARNAADALGTFRHPSAIASLSAALDNGALDGEARGHVVRALGVIGHVSANSAIARGLADGDAFVRREAVLAWAKVRGQQGAAPVASLVNDANELVRREAITVVGRFKEGSARSALETVLATSPDPFSRRNAAYALGQIGDLASRPVLEAAVNDSSALVRGFARDALRRLR